MSTDRPRSTAVHASAVAISGQALLIIGPSRAGKSSLAYALLASSSAHLPIRLIGDDRILVSRDVRSRFVCRPHPRIAGFIERRGLGIVAVPFVDRSPLAGIVQLAATASLPPDLGNENFPTLSLVNEAETAVKRDLVLRWWAAGQKRGMHTTPDHESASAPAARSEKLELVTPTRSYICASRGDEAVRSN